MIGTPVRRAADAEAEAAIAGFEGLNDVTVRDWQYRTPQWLQGKTFEGSTPFGSVLVTLDELPGGVRPALALRCEVDGETVQESTTADLVFDQVALARYISQIVTRHPGNVIASGTPAASGTRGSRRGTCVTGPPWSRRSSASACWPNAARMAAAVPA